MRPWVPPGPRALALNLLSTQITALMSFGSSLLLRRRRHVRLHRRDLVALGRRPPLARVALSAGGSAVTLCGRSRRLDA